MIYVFGDLRQLRSFELTRPSISSPQRLRPLRNSTTAPVRPPPPQPVPWPVPITRPPIIPKPEHVPSPLSNTGLQSDNANPRVTISSVCTDSFISCDSHASCTSTTSSDQVEIHISEAFQDIEPPYIGNDLTSSSPVPSSWQGESPSNASWIPGLMGYNADSALPPSPASRKLSLPVDNVFRSSNARTSTTFDREEEKEKWIPTASFIRPFGYNEWEEWDGESIFCTTEGSLGGYGAGDEESRISNLVHPPRFGQDGPRSIGTRVSSQLGVGSRRGTVTSSKGPEQSVTFDFDALPAFQATTSGSAAIPRKPRYRTCDASPPPPLIDETTLTEAVRRGGTLRTWFVEVPKVFIRRTQGKCGAAKQVIRDVMSRSAVEMSRRNGGGDGEGGPYRDISETGDGRQRSLSAGELSQDRASNGLTINTVPRSQSNSHQTASKAKEKGKLDVKQTKEGWRARWKRVLSVPAFRSPLTKILSPVVTRAQWEVVVRSGIVAFVISVIVLAVFVAVPVPP